MAISLNDTLSHMRGLLTMLNDELRNGKAKSFDNPSLVNEIKTKFEEAKRISDKAPSQLRNQDTELLIKIIAEQQKELERLSPKLFTDIFPQAQRFSLGTKGTEKIIPETEEPRKVHMP